MTFFGEDILTGTILGFGVNHHIGNSLGTYALQSLFENQGLVVFWNQNFSDFRQVIGKYKIFYVKLCKESRRAPLPNKYTDISVVDIRIPLINVITKDAESIRSGQDQFLSPNLGRNSLFAEHVWI